MTERKRIRRSAKDWKGVVERYESGGMSAKAFCRREGLNEATFRIWRGRIRSATNGTVPFVEVVPARGSESPWTIELEFPNGTKLRMRG